MRIQNWLSAYERAGPDFVIVPWSPKSPEITYIPWVLQAFSSAYGIFQNRGKVISIDFVTNVAGMRLKRSPFNV